VDMCKGKRKYDYEEPMTSSLSDCTWLEKEWKFRLSTMWHPSLHFIFLSFDSSLSYLSCHSSFLFLLFLSFSHTHIFFYFTFLYIFFSFFFSILILFSLFFPLLTSFSLFSKLSTPLFLACTQSEILNKPC
jgi:hypothetical protein